MQSLVQLLHINNYNYFSLQLHFQNVQFSCKLLTYNFAISSTITECRTNCIFLRLILSVNSIGGQPWPSG